MTVITEGVKGGQRSIPSANPSCKVLMGSHVMPAEERG